MKIQRILIIFTAIVCILAIAPWVVTFWEQPLSNIPADWGVFGDYVGGVLSGPLAIVGFIALLLTIQQQRTFARDERNKANDLRYFESAQKCLMRAYQSIKPSDAGIPSSKRLVWLTTARWILSADSISDKISSTSPALKDAFELEAEYYRGLFSEFLKPNEIHSVFSQKSFFVGDASINGAEIEERSVRVILDFMKWPDSKNDPLRHVPPYSKQEAEEMHVWLRGFQAYLLEKPRFRSKE